MEGVFQPWLLWPILYSPPQKKWQRINDRLLDET